jgi:two-component system, NarL family, sensor kinase
MEASEIKITLLILTVLSLMMGVFVFLFVLIYKRNQNRKEIQIEKLNKTILQTQLEIKEQTLKTISEEIHDNIGQVLSLAKLNLNTFPENLDGIVKEKIIDTEILLSKAINDLRDLSQSMHGDNIAAIGFQASLEQELKLLEKTGKFETGMQVLGSRFSLESQKETVLFRIVQEALHNAVKHANAKRIGVNLNYETDALILLVIDDGQGFEINALNINDTGIGIGSMKKRALLIGGTCSIHSVPGEGTTVKTVVPK